MEEKKEKEKERRGGRKGGEEKKRKKKRKETSELDLYVSIANIIVFVVGGRGGDTSCFPVQANFHFQCIQ